MQSVSTGSHGYKPWCIRSNISSWQSGREQSSQQSQSVTADRVAGGWGSTVWALCAHTHFLQSGYGSGLCPAWLVAVPCVYHRPFIAPPAQLPAAVSALCHFCTSNCICCSVTEAKEKCKLLRDEGGAEFGMLLFTWQNIWTCWKPHEDSAMVWGFLYREP